MSRFTAALVAMLVPVALAFAAPALTAHCATSWCSTCSRSATRAASRFGEFGVGDPFSFPLQSVESLEVLGGGRLLIANDNNYPGSDGRWAAEDRPDDTELIIVDVGSLGSNDDD
jgi:hypothetical protein